MQTGTQTKATLPEAQPNTPSFSCLKCGHIRICSAFRANLKLLSTWTDETRPFEAESLARICKLHVSSSLIDAVNTQLGES